MIKGLDLSRSYYQKFGEVMIDQNFPEYIDQIAVGLVGEGSECFGYDDIISRDHDHGPGFCIWLPEKIYVEIGKDMQNAYDMLPKEFEVEKRIDTPQGKERVGILSIERFYRRYTGVPGAPKNNQEWQRIPESFLATATNGEVFYDNEGSFTVIRNILKRFYPEAVRKEKLAARAITMGQAGQYNYPRCIKRMDKYAAYLSCAEFVNAALSAFFLINKFYMPFYKWIFRMAEELKILKSTVDKIRDLVILGDDGDYYKQKEILIEEICVDVCTYFNQTGLTHEKDHFLAYHGEEIFREIK